MSDLPTRLRNHVTPSRAEMAAYADEVEALAEWPCADYKAPITCLTTPKPKTLLCGWCSTQPNRAEVQALYQLAERDDLRAKVARVEAVLERPGWRRALDLQAAVRAALDGA